ncbi:MAG: MarR family winged helix-turn-helix transcriptional regulator [Tetrasphaera sp.]
MATANVWLTDSEQALWRRWIRVNLLLSAGLHRELQRDSELSLPDFEVLVHLSESPDGRVRVCDLAAGLQWERSRLSHHVSRMERRGLVARAGCPEDGRGAFVAITASGRSSIEQAAPGHVREVRRLLFDQLSAAEVGMLTAALDKVLAGME